MMMLVLVLSLFLEKVLSVRSRRTSKAFSEGKSDDEQLEASLKTILGESPDEDLSSVKDDPRLQANETKDSRGVKRTSVQKVYLLSSQEILL